MKAHSDIEPGGIGLWGVSMAGYVMPRVLTMTEDIAFMICVSCPGMAGVDQGAYLTAAQGMCAGVPEENADRLEGLLADLERARTYSTYDEYRQYRAVLAALTELGSQARYGGREVIPEPAWQANDPNSQGWWNPIEGIEHVRIPVLAIFGERDTQVDPVQGAHAWRKALAQAGNPNFRVEVLPGADHMPGVSATGCTAETQQTVEKMLQEQGYNSLDEAFALFQEEPGQHSLLSAYPYAPGYLDLIEEWLRGLPL
jgi:pimeloyl-ACP methyl ester carboxylesterase